MYPVIFDTVFLGQRIYLGSFQLFALLGIVASALVMLWLSDDMRRKPVAYIFYLFGIFCAAAIGAKLFEIIVEYPAQIAQGRDFWGAVSYAGSSVNGGIIGGGIAIAILSRFDPFKALTWRSVDALAIAVPLGHALGRVGCFFNGCCYGKLCSPDTLFAITYPKNWVIDNPILFPQGIVHGPRLPAPLFEAAGLLAIGLVLLLIFKRTRARGQIVALYLTLYSVLRFFQEYSRDDAYRGIREGLSSGQWFSLFAFAAGIALLALFLFRLKRGRAFPPYSLLNGRKPGEYDAFDTKTR